MNGDRALVRKRLSPGARRAQIIESARAVWSRAGARRTTVRDIADEAGVTEHFVYQLFDSREEIFKLAVLDPLDALVASLAKRIRAVARDADFSCVLQVHRNLHEAFLAEVVEMIPLMAAAQFADPVEGPKFYSGKLYPAVRRSVLSLMGRLTGFSPRSIEMDVAIRTLMGAHFAVALETVLDGEQLQVRRVADDLTRIFSQGFAHAKAALDTIELLPEAEPMPTLASSAVAKNNEEFVSGRDSAIDAMLLGRKQLARADRIEAIRMAARGVFLTHGLTGARSMQLAKKAGITEAFMFRIFESKEHIYEAAILQPLEDAFVGFAARVSTLASTNPGVKFLPKFVQIALPFFIENGPLCVSALFSELGEGRKYFRQVLLPHLRTIERVLATQQGLIDAAVDPQTARRAIFGAHWAISFDNGRRYYPVDSNRVIKILTQLLTRDGSNSRDP